MTGLFAWLKENWELLISGIAIYILIFSTLLGVSWLFGYWYNGITSGKFEINSCWQGLTIVLVNVLTQAGLIVASLMRFNIDSRYNSLSGMYPNTRSGSPNLPFNNTNNGKPI